MAVKNRPEVTIRPAAPEDAAAITPLCSQLGYPAAVADVLSRLHSLAGEDEHRVFAAELQDGQIAGWVHVYVYKPFYSDRMAEIAGLVVDEAFRGLGVGKELMLAAEGWAKEKSCSVVSLRSNVIRTEAHAFYKNIGYDAVKEQYTFRKRI